MGTSSALARLDALEERVREAEASLATAQAARGRAAREVSAAEAAEAAHHEAVAAGDAKPDAKREAALAASVRAARDAAGGHVWQAKVNGAERALVARREEAAEFVRDHFADLAAEEAVHDGPARDALEAAWEALQDAQAGYARRIAAWHRIARYGVLDPADIPPLPTRGDRDEVRNRFTRGIALPTPTPLRQPTDERG